VKDKPLHEVRIGQVKAAVWQRRKSRRSTYAVLFTRAGRNGDTGKSSRVFRPDDLFALMKTADLALGWIKAQSTVHSTIVPHRD
jgi:hypothetical protein